LQQWLRSICGADHQDSKKRLDFTGARPYLVVVQCNNDAAMAEERSARRDVAVPDLLAALTAYGLRGLRNETRSRRSLKGRVMKQIDRLLDWLAAGVAEGERMRREAYLAQSSDHCDLEYRRRELEREPSFVRGWW